MKPRVHMNEIRFFVHPKSTPANVKDMLDHIANMIYGFYGQGVAVRKMIGYRWSLGYYQTRSKDKRTPNDWWADVGANGDAPNEVVIAYRYCLDKDTAEKMSKLRDTIIWLLDSERFNLGQEPRENS